MASGKGNTVINEVLNWITETGSPTRPGTTNNLRLALCITSNPSASSAATGLTPGGDYAAGGPEVTFNSASSQQITNDTLISLENDSGGTWTITGAILHDAGTSHPSASDIIYFDDSDITVDDGEFLEFPADTGIVISES